MGLLRVAVAALALPVLVGCGGGLSEAEARAMTEDMVSSSLFSPPPGASVVETRQNVCGGGSVAPYADRQFKGGLLDVEKTYRQRLIDEGWEDVRVVPAGGVGGRKGTRTVLIKAGSSGWTVSMQQGDAIAACDDLSRGEIVTGGG